MNRLVIKNGHLLDPSNQLNRQADLYIDNGRVVAIDHSPNGFIADQTIDAKGLTAIPGIVDLCARLREPGLEYKATIQSETIAAAMSGITTLCCPPDTDPVIDEPAVVELIHHKATSAGHSNVVMLGALTTGLKGELLSEMHALQIAGCVGLSNGRQPIPNTLVLKRAYAYAANCGLTVFIEPDDHWLSAGGCAHNGTIASRLGLKGIPVSAETVALARALEIVAETGVKAHFGRLSSAASVAMIRRAKNDGMNITADVSAHQLYLNEHDISSFNSACHVLPPLRTQRDQQALQQGLADGTLDAICSDHQPHDTDAKEAPFASTEPGISALATLLPLATRLADQGIVDICTVIKAITSSPATILGMNTGTLSVGSNADICIFDRDSSWQLDEATIHSSGKNSPFIGWNFQTRVKHTIIGGVIIHSHTE
ncbi:MAG: dihydroorotase [Gammaproteobacteria bacterium]|nr:dihydroorotase [Gammaproteobacteria bacterium]